MNSYATQETSNHEPPMPAPPVRAPLLRRALSVLAMVPALATSGVAPSFDCTRVHSELLKTICGSPRLAALDAELNEIYTAMRGQPAFAFNAFEQEESDWLHRVRDRCVDAACIARAYTDRIAALKERSERAASPAAYDETRPFPAPTAVLAEARAYIGKPCTGYASDAQGFILPGFQKPKGFFEIRSGPVALFVRDRHDTRFIFLAKYGQGACRFSDLATLPAAAQANELLSCSYGGPPDASEGVGIRRAGADRLMAYWEIDEANGRLLRQPLGVLGVEDSIHCQAVEGDE